MILGPSILQRRDGDGTVTFFKTCNVTGKEYSVTLTDFQHDLIRSPNRPSIQEALPHFTADQREFLMTGITPAEWNKTFPPEE